MQAKIKFADLNYRLWLGALALLVFASALLSSPPALSQAFPGGGGRNGDAAEVLKSLNLGGGGNFGGGRFDGGGILCRSFARRLAA